MGGIVGYKERKVTREPDHAVLKVTVSILASSLTEMSQ